MNSRKQSDIAIMGKLIILIKPLSAVMLLGILLGVLGFLCAIFLTIAGGYGVIKVLYSVRNIDSSFLHLISLKQIFISLLVMAIARGILHYGEQYCNHYIAFRILAIIRHKVFHALCRLCPAKLEGKERGNLISIITGDIELLEVFFAHTVSPIAIAFLTSLFMVIFISAQHLIAGIIALCGYITVGVILPIRNGKRNAATGMNFRNEVGELNNFILNSMYGVDEIIQYNQGDKRLSMMNSKSLKLSATQKSLSEFEGSQRVSTNMIIQFFSWGIFFVMLLLYQKGAVDFSKMLIATLAMMSSFGPTVALSSLSNSLNQTLACGERVLSLLLEDPEVLDVCGKEDVGFDGINVENVGFSYDKDVILHDVSLSVPKGKVLGIYGVSGSGKSTLLKLLMRFWDVDRGMINISGKNIKDINTANLRQMTGYVTQETVMFNTTIGDNIRVSKRDAAMAEIENAAKKASIHDFIINLPKGYDTNVGELGDSLSDGEKQRIGLARAFLHDSDLILLDEPTSNLDVLNEGIILKSLENTNKTLVLVSHRKSTLSIAHKVYEMKQGRVS